VQIDTLISLYDSVNKSIQSINELPTMQYTDMITQSKSLIQQITASMDDVKFKSEKMNITLQTVDNTDTTMMKKAVELHTDVSAKLLTTAQQLTQLNNTLSVATGLRTNATSQIITVQQSIQQLIAKAATIPLQITSVNTLIANPSNGIGNVSTTISVLTSILTTLNSYTIVYGQFLEDFDSLKQLMSSINNNALTLLRQILYVSILPTTKQVVKSLKLYQYNDGSLQTTILFTDNTSITTGGMQYSLIPNSITTESTNGIVVIPVDPVELTLMPVATVTATLPIYKGCYSSAPKAYNGYRIATDYTHGIANVTECNAAAKAAGKNYFGMSYW
jgi:myosin heavy subunit